MAGWRHAVELAMSCEDIGRVMGISRSRTERASRVERAQVLLAYQENPSFFAVGEKLGVHHQTVQRRVERGAGSGGLAALDDRPRPGKEPTITPDAKAWLVSLACDKAKEHGYAHELWTMCGLISSWPRIWQLEMALCSLQRLDRRLLVHGQHQRVVGWSSSAPWSRRIAMALLGGLRQRQLRAVEIAADELHDLRGRVAKERAVLRRRTRQHVVDHHRRDGGDQSQRGREQGFGDARRHHGKVGGVRFRDADEAVHDAPDRADRPGDQRGDGEADHHQFHDDIGMDEHAPWREVLRQLRGADRGLA